MGATRPLGGAARVDPGRGARHVSSEEGSLHIGQHLEGNSVRLRTMA